MDLEEEYKKLVQSMYDRVKEDYQARQLDDEEANKLLELVLERTGIENQNEEVLGWQRSSWCS